jgi:hypothetical protein
MPQPLLLLVLGTQLGWASLQLAQVWTSRRQLHVGHS